MTNDEEIKKSKQQTPGENKFIKLTPEQDRSRRARNLAIGVAIALFGGLFYFVTIAKLGGNVAHLPQ